MLISSLLHASAILDDRRTLSRERNKIHARRTRQRKKEHMQDLEKQASELKALQITLKQQINEQNTINILLNFSSSAASKGLASGNGNAHDCDLKNTGKSKNEAKVLGVDELLKRENDDIPDASKIPELPALVLPGHHNNRKRALDTSSPDAKSNSSNTAAYPNDGIDYELLAKDRSTCTPAELDKIRRERNRMHAKRTRDRKKRFTEEMESIIKSLHKENELLNCHLASMNSKSKSTAMSNPNTTTSGSDTPALGASPVLQPCTQAPSSSVVSLNGAEGMESKEGASDSIETTTTVTEPSLKRQCFGDTVPSSITTTTHHSPAAIGC